MAEIRRNADRGFTSVTFPERPHEIGLPSLWDRAHWDPIMEAVVETDTVVSLHVGSSGLTPAPPGAGIDPLHLGATLFGQLSLTACAEWLWSGYPLRLPTLKIAMSEGGIGWVAMLADRLDNIVDRSGYGAGWEVRPAEVLRRNFWFCTIDDPSTIDTRHAIGVDHIMVEVDYPHGDSTWPDTQDVIEKCWGHIPAARAARHVLRERRRPLPPPAPRPRPATLRGGDRCSRPTADKLMPDLTPREELVVLARALWREGYNDHLAGHITVNLGDGTLLCNPWLLTWAELRPSQVLRIDLDGRVVEGDWPVPLGIPLHLELHKLRADVGWAVHNHPLFGTVWADLAELPPILDQSSALGGGTLALVDEYEGPVNDPGSARRAVEQMGEAVHGAPRRARRLRPRRLGPRRAPARRGARATLPARLVRPRRRRLGRLPRPAGVHRPRGPERRRGLPRLLGGGRPGRAGGRPRPARLTPVTIPPGVPAEDRHPPAGITESRGQG